MQSSKDRKITITNPLPLSSSHDIQELTYFLMEYALAMIISGAYTARVIRCVRRLGDAFGYEVYMSIFTKSISMTVASKNDYNLRRTYIRGVYDIHISFIGISDLSALSWQALDQHLSFEEVRKRFVEITQAKRVNWWLQLLFICLANAAFCHLFGGDYGSSVIVLVTTFVGFSLRKILMLCKIDLRLIFIACSFVSSLLAYLSSPLAITQTLDVAVASSVLYLIPGVQMINSVIDILDGHVLVGASRGINVGILIVCIAIGIYLSLKISGVAVL